MNEEVTNTNPVLEEPAVIAEEQKEPTTEADPVPTEFLNPPMTVMKLKLPDPRVMSDKTKRRRDRMAQKFNS